MATCLYPGCGTRNWGSALPPGWTLVIVERRRPGGRLFDIDRRRWVLCPFHSDFVALEDLRRRRTRVS